MAIFEEAGNFCHRALHLRPARSEFATLETTYWCEVLRMDRSVLIVDDSSAVRQALVRLFADGGFDVCGEAASGREAIEKAQGLNPGLIVMDLSMPMMNGIEAARCLRQLLPTVLIIILSDYGGLFPEQEARSLGIAAIVSKAECSSVLLHEARTLLCQTAA